MLPLNGVPPALDPLDSGIGEVRLWIALLAAFGSGVLVSVAIGLARGARIRLVARRYRRLVAGLQAEVHQLRSLPLSDEASPSGGDPLSSSSLERGMSRTSRGSS